MCIPVLYILILHLLRAPYLYSVGTGYVPRVYHHPRAGTRQGDPLSLALFSLVVSFVRRGAQGGFSRRTHIIATLVQAATLWGTPGAEVSRRDLQSLETAVLHSLWGTSRPGRAKEIIFVLLVQGHRVSPHMKTTYDRVCWLLAVARTPGTLQVWCSRALKLGKHRYDPLHQDRFNEASWSWRALAGGRRIIGGSGMCPGCPKK